jgi:hypothetical protein
VSVPVPIERLRAETARFGAAFLLTVTDDARPHAVAVAPEWDGDSIVVSAGRTTRKNASARPDVSLLWPAGAPGEFSLIVDGSAVVDDGTETLVLTASRAVLHRPAAGGGSDCVDLSKPPPA